ncbi:uncharacterized protein K441DRAFT_14753 [Cenococcum geophilum 1.58]|uniref:uncharacterized protein n=1 Tax=Cenococcum geophilum 1.58 TaxID=794803 RepID=UPI00358F9060|nr:hypothetical protein K441DRAFT_14753 [Cenococcum geophilum 1.58]
MNAIDLTERIRQMDTANIISISVVLLVPPGIQGVLNRTLATAPAPAVNTQLHAIYRTDAHTARFPVSCSAELIRLRARPRRRGRHAARLHQHGWRQRGRHQLPGRAGHQRMYASFDFPASSAWERGVLFSSETAAHALRLMVSGLFDRHLTPKVALGHCGEGLPFVLAIRACIALISA